MRPARALALVLLLAAAPAAGETADACAAALGKDSRAIYDASVAGATPGVDLKALLGDTTRGLARAGTIARTSARDSARAALPCLQLKQQGQ